MNGTPPSTTETQSCGLAIWSLVLGICSLVLCILSPLFAIPAVICGHLALGRIKRSAGTMSGRGPAIGGLVTGYLGIAMIPIIGMMSAIAIPNFVKARDAAQRTACIVNLRSIQHAKDQWAFDHSKGTNAIPTQADLQPYLGAGTMPTCPKGGTYQINAVGKPPTCSIPGHELPD